MGVGEKGGRGKRRSVKTEKSCSVWVSVRSGPDLHQSGLCEQWIREVLSILQNLLLRARGD